MVTVYVLTRPIIADAILMTNNMARDLATIRQCRFVQ